MVAVPALVSDSPVYVNDSVIFFESGVITGQLFGSFQSPILRLIQKQPTSCENQQPNGTVTICMWVDSEHSESDYVLVAAEDLQDLQECSNSVEVVDDQLEVIQTNGTQLLLCGNTTHFTDFAILLKEDLDDLQCSQSQSWDLLLILHLSSLSAVILLTLIVSILIQRCRTVRTFFFGREGERINRLRVYKSSFIKRNSS